MAQSHLDSLSYQADRIQVADTHTDKMFNDVHGSTIDARMLISNGDLDKKLQALGILPRVDLFDSQDTLNGDVQTLSKTTVIGTIDQAKLAGTTVGNDQMKPVMLGDSVDSSMDMAFTAASFNPAQVGNSNIGNSSIVSAYAAFASAQQLTPADRLAIELSKEVVKGVGNAFKEAWFGTPETEEQARARYEAEQAEMRAQQAEDRRREEEQRLHYQREQQHYNS